MTVLAHNVILFNINRCWKNRDGITFVNNQEQRYYLKSEDYAYTKKLFKIISLDLEDGKEVIKIDDNLQLQ